MDRMHHRADEEESVKERRNGIYLSRCTALSVALLNVFLLVACISLLLLQRGTSPWSEVHRAVRQAENGAPGVSQQPGATTHMKHFTPLPSSSSSAAAASRSSSLPSSLSSTPAVRPYNATRPPGDELRLPTNLRPFHYDIHWRPDIYHPSPNQFTLNATAKIYLRCHTPSDVISFNYRRLAFDTSSYTVVNIKDNSTIPITIACADRVKEVYNITLARPLVIGEEVVLTMKYTAYIQDGPIGDMVSNAGVFRSQYMVGNETRYSVFTQMATTEARTTFPCVDDPLAKATFTISVDRQINLTTLSNTPINNTVSDGSGNSNWVTDVFQTTKNMSTYLVAFAVSDYTNVTVYSKGINPVKIGLWAQSDFVKAGYLNYTSMVVPAAVEYYSNYFNYSYNWPKLDLASIPGKNFLAMENWGLSFFQSDYILFDDYRSDNADRVEVAFALSDIIFHNWLGNTVTIDWWDDSWLIVGMATFFQYQGIQNLQPTWDTDQLFFYETFYSQSMWMDDRGIASKLYNPNITSFAEINSQITAVTANKGASVLRMLCKLVVGEEVFRMALQEYIQEYAYGNADHEQLFEEMMEEYMRFESGRENDTRVMENGVTRGMENGVTRGMENGVTRGMENGVTRGMENNGTREMENNGTREMENNGTRGMEYNGTREMEFNVTEVMSTWIMQKGYPLVTVTREKNPFSTRLTLSQEIYLAPQNLTAEHLEPSPYRYLWEIPITYITSYDPRPIKVWMHREKQSFVMLNRMLTENEWVLVNHNLSGYYRVNYDEGNWGALTNQLTSDHMKIPLNNRAQLIEDSFDLLLTGRLSPVYGLSLSDYLVNETEYLPWKLFHENFEDILKRISSNVTLYTRMQQYALGLLQNNYRRLGWNAASNDNITTIFLRRLTLDMACSVNDASCINNALDLFKKLKSNGFDDFMSVTPDQRHIVYCAVAANGSYDDWMMLVARYQATLNNFTSESEDLTLALTCTKNTTTITSLFQTIHNQEVRIIARKDYINVLTYIAQSPQGYSVAWDYLSKNGMSAFERIAILKSLASVISTSEEATKLDTYLKAYPTRPGDEEVTVTGIKQTIQENINWIQNYQQNISDFLTLHNIL